MIKNNIKLNYLEFVFSGFFIILLLFPKLVTLYIILMALTIFYSYYRKEIIFQLYKGALTYSALYLVYIIGMYWTQDSRLAEFYAVNKLSFVVFPFLLAFKKKNGFKLSIVIWGLMIACLLSFARGIYIGIPCFATHFSFPYCFMKSYLSPIIHPTYMSVFAQFSFLSVIYLLAKKELSKRVGYLLLGVFSLFIFLLMSLSGMLFFFLILLGMLVYWLKKKYSNRVVLIVIPLALIVLFITVFTTPFLKEDVIGAKNSIGNYINSPSEYIKSLPSEPKGSDVRLIMWTVSCQEIEKYPFGIGTGNVDKYLGDNLKSHGMETLASHNYNPHNQFLQTTLEIGIFGGLLLLIIFIVGFYEAYKFKSWMLFLLFLSLFINCLFESMLQTQAGIIFYPLIYMLVLIDLKSTHKISS